MSSIICILQQQKHYVDVQMNMEGREKEKANMTQWHYRAHHQQNIFMICIAPKETTTQHYTLKKGGYMTEEVLVKERERRGVMTYGC